MCILLLLFIFLWRWWLWFVCLIFINFLFLLLDPQSKISFSFLLKTFSVNLFKKCIYVFIKYLFI